jgi:hypothetical protein
VLGVGTAPAGGRAPDGFAVIGDVMIERKRELSAAVHRRLQANSDENGTGVEAADPVRGRRQLGWSRTRRQPAGTRSRPCPPVVDSLHTRRQSLQPLGTSVALGIHVVGHQQPRFVAASAILQLSSQALQQAITHELHGNPALEVIYVPTCGVCGTVQGSLSALHSASEGRQTAYRQRSTWPALIWTRAPSPEPPKTKTSIRSSACF